MTELDLTEVKDTVRRHWEDRAADFDDGPTHGLLSAAQRSAWIQRVSGWAGATPIDTLDAGCGTGFFALQLAELGHRSVGVDVADAMLARARRKADEQGLAVEFRLADAERLPFGDAVFDLVIERHLMWTLPDPAGALTEWARVLRPGGRLVLVEGDWGSTGNETYAAIREALPLYGGRPAVDLAALATANGYRRIEVEPLMDAALWEASPERDRYALLARRT